MNDQNPNVDDILNGFDSHPIQLGEIDQNKNNVKYDGDIEYDTGVLNNNNLGTPTVGDMAIENDDDFDEQVSTQEKSFSSHPSSPSCLKRTRNIAFFTLGCLLLTWCVLWISSELSPPTYLSAIDPTPWNTYGRNNGVEIAIDNALEDKWIPYFEESMNEWDNDHPISIPDAVTISSRRVAYDYECTPVRGKVKICNGDYGNTDWVGICISLISHTGYKIDSIVKLNDHFLDDGVIVDRNIQRRYTMCHELGHALGLPHTDENHWNINQGNCMDYTAAFRQTNVKPGNVNYQTLYDLYGSASPLPQQSEGGTIIDDDNERMLLRHRRRRHGRRVEMVYNETEGLFLEDSASADSSKDSDGSSSSSNDSDDEDDMVVPDDIDFEYKELAKIIQNSTCSSITTKNNKRRKKKKNNNEKDFCAVDLGAGYNLVVQKLF